MSKLQQEIVIRVSECDERRRSKAMRAASKKDGVRSVAINVVGERNHLVVSGVGVDSVELTRSLRRIFEYAHIVSVRNIGQTSTEEACFRSHDFMFQNHYPTQSYHHQPSNYNYVAVPVYDSDPPPMCSIM